ncbi:hypothetical protein NQ315_000756 [Exocentrus adspersus]|uniref:acid phosphatase n=1 Tax=Exocentrus adspersus TaxID=1586481 RepID=A0AAV8WEC5_9CUCU|nr:hypothetical protein NQ315_000756 [Exocentrus adspersus]
MLAAVTTVSILCFLIGAGESRHITYPTAEAGDELVSVVVMYRHGDRSPIASFQNDPYYDSSYWPEGYGQLLSKGVLRHYNLGKWLRNRYGSFLPAEYSPKHIQVYSTDVDRTLMSAQANLAGLYTPVDSHIWEEGFLWEPVPIHRLALDDPVLAMNSACPKQGVLEGEVKQSDFYQTLSKDNSDLFKTLSEYTGMSVGMGTISIVYDVIYVYRNHNESFVPSWVEDVDMEQVNYLASMAFAKSIYTDELKRLKTGPFYNYLINYFSDVISGDSDVAKFLMLSAHDSTISYVLGGMGAFDFQPPEFASSVIWELRKNTDGHYINVLYKRNSTDTYDDIKVYECSLDCAFDDFKLNMAGVSVDPETWHEECQINSY